MIPMEPRYRDAAWVARQIRAQNRGRILWVARFRIPPHGAARAEAAFLATKASRVVIDDPDQFLIEFNAILTPWIARVAVEQGGILCEQPFLASRGSVSDLPPRRR